MLGLNGNMDFSLVVASGGYSLTVACGLFSGCGNGGLLSSRSARASHCGDFSCGVQTLGHMGSVVVAPGL